MNVELFKFNCTVTDPHGEVPNCEPHHYKAKRGRYRIELWGAQGGSFPTAEGGHGGYVSGVFSFSNVIDLYFFLGESGFIGTKTDSLTRNTFGFGGRGVLLYDSPSNYEAGASGGGMTYMTINFPSIDDAIMKAAGGGGAAIYHTNSYNGGHAGGLEGRDGMTSTWGSTSYPKGTGGKQNSPGENSNDSLFNGKFTYGGNVTRVRQIASGGGAGHYGGAAGSWYGATGGGGSSWIHPLVAEAVTFAGDEMMPSPDSNAKVSGWKGHGCARITKISPYSVVCSYRIQYTSCLMKLILASYVSITL